MLASTKTHVIAVDSSLMIIDHVVGVLHPSGLFAIFPAVAYINQWLNSMLIPQGAIKLSIIKALAVNGQILAEVRQR